jgi:predicted nucleic acid-binding protein
LDRIFLDANVLFSAAYAEHSALARLWSLDDVQLISSALAIEEARRNLAIDRPGALTRLESLTARIVITDAPAGLRLPEGVRLDAKDQPILLAAIHSGATYLLTGDARHFGHLYGNRIGGVRVLRPALYFARMRGRST